MSTAAIDTRLAETSTCALPNRTNGHLEEERFREVLRSTGKLDVRYDQGLDYVFKLDAVVLVKNAPMLPAVGVQFTMRNCPQKQEKAMQVVRQTRVVNRFLYLRCHAPMTERAAGILFSLVLLVATMKSTHGIVVAALEADSRGSYYITAIQSYPLG